jgi:hypothetical protein
MNNCKIIQDLIPLVNDGVASDESRDFVLEHCEGCRECNEVLDMNQTANQDAASPNDALILKKIRKRLNFSKALFTGIGILTALLAWGIWGKLTGNLRGNEIGFTVIIMWLVMPVTSFAITLILSIKDYFWKWIFPFIACAFGYIIPLVMFRNAGAAGLEPLMLSLVPALLGLGIGLLICKLRKRRSN